MTTEEQNARYAIEAVCQTLDNACRHLAQQRPYTEADQRATRLLNSRKRLLWRLFDYRYATGAANARATQELNLPTPDTGELIEFYGRHHVRGWLGCRACEQDSGDAQFPVSQARLCQVCRQGIQHACLLVTARQSTIEPAAVRQLTFSLSGGIMVREVSNVQPGPQNSPTGSLTSLNSIPVAPDDAPKRAYCCDRCNSVQIEDV